MKISLAANLVFVLGFAAATTPCMAVDFVLIEGGAFLMGSHVKDPERGHDEIGRRVSVSDFHLARSELTQKEYTALIGSHPS